MAKLSDDYMKQLNAYLDDPSTISESFKAKEIKGNVSIEEKRDNSKQALLYMVIDKSVSMRGNGLEDAVRQGLADVKRTVNGSKEVDYIQTAMTFFGSSVEMRPFQYGECIDISYEATDSSTRLYDAVIESCQNMVAQYDKFEPTTTVKGVMLVFTDGEENASQHSLKELQDTLSQMLGTNLKKDERRDIRFLVATFKGVDVRQLAQEFNTEPIIIDDDHKLRRLMDFVSKNVAE